MDEVMWMKDIAGVTHVILWPLADKAPMPITALCGDTEDEWWDADELYPNEICLPCLRHLLTRAEQFQQQNQITAEVVVANDPESSAGWAPAMPAVAADYAEKVEREEANTCEAMD